MLKAFLDAGHGGKASGAYDPINAASGDFLVTTESKMALSVTFYAKAALERTGQVEVLMSRVDDTFVSLADRCWASNKFKADVFASIHFNGHANEKARGIEVFAHHEGGKGEVVAKRVYQYSAPLTPWADRGVKFNSEYAVLNGTEAPAILFEGGFITNTEEEKLINTELYRKSLGEAIARGICEAFGIEYVAPAVKPLTNTAAQVQKLTDDLTAQKALNSKLNGENSSLVVEITKLRAKVADLEKKYSELGPQIKLLTDKNLEQSRVIADLKNKVASYLKALSAIKDTASKV